MREHNPHWKRTSDYRPSGMTQKEVAETLGISVDVVQHDEASALRKLFRGVMADAEIVAYAQENLSIEIDVADRIRNESPPRPADGQQLGLVFSTTPDGFANVVESDILQR